jgi:hypothetical protein
MPIISSSPRFNRKKICHRVRPLAFILIAPLGVNSVSNGSLPAYLARVFQSLTVALHFGEYKGVN